MYRYYTKRSLISLVVAIPLLAVLIGAGNWVATAHAVDTRSGDYTRVKEGETVRSMLFASGRQIDIAGTIEGDLFCAGQNVTITGRIEGDVICAAQSVRITGTVEGDVRVAAQTLAVGGAVDGNLTAATQILTIENEANIGRDASAAAADVTIDGTVGRDAKIGAEMFVINGSIGRDVDAHSSNVTVGSSAVVMGNLMYESDRELRRGQGAEIIGQVNRIQPQSQDSTAGDTGIGFRLYLFFAVLLLSLVLALLGPGAFRAVSTTALRAPGKTILVGLVISILVPILILVLMLTLIGIPLGLLALLLWIVILFFSGPATAFTVGQPLLKRYSSRENAVLVMLAGSVLVLALYFVPFINVLAVLAVVWFGVGSITLNLWDMQTSLRKKSRQTVSDMDTASNAAAPGKIITAGQTGKRTKK